MTSAAESQAPGRAPRELPYKLAWRSSGIRAGVHKSRMTGAGGLFRDHASLLDFPDPRRIDLRVSVRDPFGGLYVKRFEQRNAVTVYAVVDVSGSMGFSGNAEKMALVSDLIASLAWSVRRAGDSFGLIACGDGIEENLDFHASRSRESETRMLERLERFEPRGRATDGLVQAAQRLAGRRKLVFLISDFNWPQPVVESVFAAFSTHDVVPILLRDRREVDDLPSWGLLSLADLETGRRRVVAMRPSLKAAWKRQEQERLDNLNLVAGRYGRLPFFITDKIDWDRLSAYLMTGA
jgi:uncharacterized protein (DUF58 family)